MEYEIVELEEKVVMGVCVRISNQDENMPKVIGGLWQHFFADGMYKAIEHKKNQCSIGLYSDYESDVNGLYDVTVCCEVNECEQILDGIVVKKIPSGKYAKFIVKGHMQRAIADFWTKLWSMKLDRKYSCDFEEYQSGGNIDNCEIHVYISLN
ncbi:GyrI-like domain-containing protein [Inconstantimicrobium mannanitabidum]|uniref:AraC family transcriptional regulator n=1 Tax=Inconstantimicrobium mannanitabidum TaxID=1604901 RepID=A0ACB5R8K5_9CLOT|nr:GyrI-like domain-containing protein [Clostridium sp. TW13]GKX65366.1 AraC family transcriptional regulator [Clostridium sp. TW13]